MGTGIDELDQLVDGGKTAAADVKGKWKMKLAGAAVAGIGALVLHSADESPGVRYTGIGVVVAGVLMILGTGASNGRFDRPFPPGRTGRGPSCDANRNYSAKADGASSMALVLRCDPGVSRHPLAAFRRKATDLAYPAGGAGEELLENGGYVLGISGIIMATLKRKRMSWQKRTPAIF